jgi:hypothetical protein
MTSATTLAGSIRQKSTTSQVPLRMTLRASWSSPAYNRHSGIFGADWLQTFANHRVIVYDNDLNLDS